MTPRNKRTLADKMEALESGHHAKVMRRASELIAEELYLLADQPCGEDIHTRTAAEIFSVAPGDVTAEMRRAAKAVNYAVLYGMRRKFHPANKTKESHE